MTEPRRRVTYVIPPPAEPAPRLVLPPTNAPRLGQAGPLLHPARDQPPPTPLSSTSSLPQHRLGVTCLALDTTTQLQNRAAPEGILFSGGKDGLVIAWDLGLPMRRHRRVSQLGGSTRGLARWEIMTGWADDAIDEEQEGEDRPTSDGDILGDVTISRRRANTITAPAPRWEVDREALASASTNKPPRSQFRQSAQMHRDWVNDIVLCNQNQTVVSASSDGSVKAWNPHSLSDPVRIGAHADYVRCLTQCRTQNWVASGSFDRTIKIWDLGAPPSSEPTPLMTLSSHSTSDPLSPKIGTNAAKAPSSSSPKSSVYALAADPYGHTIASGSPERVVRLWDPRSGKRTGKLVGHTDNIRSILISEDSNYLLTGSADASVKLWSLRSQRCLHTFTHHAESVWSLWSEHRSLEIFYSGDRAGLVCKVDVEDCADISEGECIVLCDDARHSRSSTTSPPTKSEGINRIVAADDTYLWTATGSASIKRWNVPPRRAERARAIFAAEEANCDASRGGEETHRSSSPDWQKAQDTASLNLSLSADHSTVSFAEPYDGRSKDGKPHTGDGMAHANDGSSTLFDIPFDSLVRLTSPNDPFTPYASMKNADPEVATLYSAASILSVPRAARSPGSAYFPHRRSHLPSPDSTMGRRQSQPSSHQPHHLVRQDTARTEYEARELAADAIPLNAEPLDLIEGTKGLVRSVILNDRTHVLTVDTEEEVAVWDILRCQCLGRWLREDIVKAMRSEEKEASNASGPQRRNSEHEHKAPLDEPRRSPRELLDAVRSRVEGEAAVPQWCSVETKVGVLAVHVTDRCFEAEVYADQAGYQGDRRWGDDGRFNLGRWVLRNLFYEFIHEESRQQRARRHEPGSPASPASPTSTSHPPGPSQWPAGLVTVAPHIVPVLPPALSPLAARSSPLITPMIPLAALGATQSGEATPVPERHLRAVTSAEVISPGREHDYFSVRGRRPSTAVGAAPVTPDETPRPVENGRVPDTPTTPSGLMGRLKNLGKMNKKANDLTSPAPLEAAEERQVHAQPVDAPPPETPSTPRQALLASQFTPPSSAEAPRYSLPHDVCVLITEESDTGPAAGGYKVVYRALAGRPDVRALEAVAPMWLLEYLLMNRAPIPPPVKLSFVLLPWPDKDGEKLPDLLNTAQSKLTASRYLRVRKLVVHVQDKLEKIRGGSRGGSISSLASAGGTGMGGAGLGGGAGVGAGAHPVERAEETYEVLCNNVVLPLDMTLAQVRQYVWRQAAELVIYYRKRAGSWSHGGRRSGEHHRGEQHAGDHRGHHRPEHRGEHLPSSGIGIQQQLAAAQQQHQEAAQTSQETTPRPPAHIPSSMVATPHSGASAHTGGRAHDAYGSRRSHDVALGAKSPASPSSPRTKHVSSAFAGAAFSL